MSSSPSLLVFGSQSSWPPSEHLARLRSRLLNDQKLAKLLASIRELPSLWNTIIDAEPQLSQVRAGDQLNVLLRWVDDGALPPSSGFLPNVLNTPLTVITHLVQYFDYLRDTNRSHAQILRSAQRGGFQGFCSGLLSAIALACSKNEDNINELGSIAVRIALLAGAFIDLDSLTSTETGEYACLAVRYKSNTIRDEVEELVQRFPKVRISSDTVRSCSPDADL